MKKTFLIIFFCIAGFLFSSNCLAAEVTFKVQDVRSSDGYILVHVKNVLTKTDVGTFKFKAQKGTTTIKVGGLKKDQVFTFIFTHDEKQEPNMNFWKDSSSTSDAVDRDSMNPTSAPVFQVTGDMTQYVEMRYFD